MCLSRLSRESGGLTSASGLIQSILKEGEASKLSEEEQWRVCSLLATAEYCMDTTSQLEEKLREKVDSSLRSSIDLTAEQDMFHKLVKIVGVFLLGDLYACLHFSVINIYARYDKPVIFIPFIASQFWQNEETWHGQLPRDKRYYQH